MDIKLIADSSCDITEDIKEKFDIEIIEIDAVCEDFTVKDRDDLFKYQRGGKSFSTSQIGIFTYVSVFEKYLKQGRDVIYLSLSSGLSGCYENAVLAKKELEGKYEARLEVVDSLSGSGGFSVFVNCVSRNLHKGMDEVLELCEFLQKNIGHIFTVLNLKYLYEGGRVSRAKKNISNLMQIFPVLSVDLNGKIFIKEFIRGKNKLDQKLYQMVESADKILIAPVYGEDEALVDSFVKRLGAFDEVIKTPIGLSIGAHIGPEIIGAGYLKNPLPDKFRW